MFLRTTFLVLTIALFSSLSWSQSLPGNLEMQDANGSTVALKSFNSSKAVVMVFYCNSCPFSNYYDDRIMNMKSSNSNISFLLVNSSPEKYDPGESLDNMKSISSRLGLPYINDKSQDLKNSLGASKCPEAFLLIKKGANWEVFYHGAIDDNPKDSDSVKEKYLEDAISSMLMNQAPKKSSNRPIGCIIKTG